MRTPRFALLALVISAPAVHAVGLPDTGQVFCDDGTNTLVECTSATTGDAAPMPRQDGRFGRDAAAAAGVLTKVGGGDAGFDYSKVCNSGELAGSGTCPADPALGYGADEWGCTQDNITGLMWEVKVNDTTHLRHYGWTYTWYNSDPATNGGNAGLADTGTGVGSDNCMDDARCDSEKFVTDVNSAGLCGHSDWRLPSKRELETVINVGSGKFMIPYIYGNIVTATTYVYRPEQAWLINSLSSGNSTEVINKTYTYFHAILIRGTEF